LQDKFEVCKECLCRSCFYFYQPFCPLYFEESPCGDCEADKTPSNVTFCDMHRPLNDNTGNKTA
jgi:hypothetical protein